jgi:hypothetical protein
LNAELTVPLAVKVLVMTGAGGALDTPKNIGARTRSI